VVGQSRGLVSRALAALEASLHGRGSALVAYSGGVDSTVVLAVAHRALGNAAVGVIARSPSLPRAELEAALELAAERGMRVDVLDTDEVSTPGYAANGPDRCYFCKTELYGRLAEEVRARRIDVLLDGFNRDDRADWRPGRRAALEHGVLSPLDEAGMGKAEVRAVARELGLSNWNRPAAACLSSRIAYGVPVTVAALDRVERAETAVRALGFSEVRVRDHGGPATIEVGADEVPLLQEDDELVHKLERRLLGLGFDSVSIDPAGYRRGSLNRRAE
jgi:uncharacterized protein